MTERSSATERPLVLITGCSGLLGSRLTRALEGKYRLVGLDLKPPGEAPPHLQFVACDLTRDDSVREALSRLRQEHGPHIASVVHLAAYYDFSGEPSDLYENLTVQGTLRLLRGLADFNVEQLIFSSTLLVMKPSEDGTPIDERSPLEVTWDYPASKVKTEQLLEEEHGELPVVILRIAGVYDDLGRSPAITEHIKRIYEKALTSWFFPGDARRGQAFVHMDDAIDAIVRTIDSRGTLGKLETLLIAEPEAVPYATLQEIIGEQIHGKEWPTLRVPKPVAKVGAWLQDKMSPPDDKPFIKPWMVDLADAHYPVDISRAKSRLGWSPAHRLSSSLPAIVQKMRNDPLGWFRANRLNPPQEALDSAEAQRTRNEAHP